MYTIDDEKLTIDDLIALQEAAITGDLRTQMDVLARCVTADDGRPFGRIPAKHYKSIVDGVLAAITPKSLPN